MKSETRLAVDLAIEQRAGSKGRKIAGYAALFDTETTIAGAFRERIAPGAFRQAVQSDDIRALINHNPERVLGRSKSGTLRLEEDAKGLRFEIDPPDTEAARELVTLIERGDVTGASFGFQARGEDWDHGTKPPLRTITDAALFDVSVVTFPAYPDAGVALRSMAAASASALKSTIEAKLAERLAKLNR
jgi:HK97 family phage prohead protease